MEISQNESHQMTRLNSLDVNTALGYSTYLQILTDELPVQQQIAGNL